MSRPEDQFEDEMLQTNVRQPGWADQSTYAASTRLPALSAYSSYHICAQNSQVNHDTTMYDGAGPAANSNVLSSAPHHSNQSQISSTWPTNFSDTTNYGYHAYTRHDGDVSSSSTAPLATSTSKTASSSRTPRVGPRKTLTDEDRRDICLYHRQHPDKKQTEIGEVFGVERSTISKILRQKEKYLGEEGGPLSRLVSQVDQPLLTWALDRERTGTRLTQEMLKRQARVLANARRLDAQAIAELERPTWIDNFLQRHPNLSSFQYPHASSSSTAQQQSYNAGSRPSLNLLPSLVSPIPSHAAVGRLDASNSFNLHTQPTTYGGRDEYGPIMPSFGTLNPSGYGYGATGAADRRTTGLYAPIDASWGGSTRSNRNYILSSTNPDPTGPPPGPSPTSRSFNLASSSMPVIPPIGTPPITSLYQSYQPSYATSDPAAASSTVQLPVIHRTWSGTQTQTIPSLGSNRVPQQSTYSSPSTSAALSSTSQSTSPPRAMPPTIQQAPSTATQEEDRAFSALMELIENDSSGVTAGGQEPIRDMTVGRLLERLHPSTRGRLEQVSPGSEESEMSSGSQRRSRREGDRQELKRTRME